MGLSVGGRRFQRRPRCEVSTGHSHSRQVTVHPRGSVDCWRCETSINPTETPRMNLHSKARTCPESRALLVERVIRLGWSVVHASEAAGVSSKTAHKWLTRYTKGGAAGLVDRSSRPRSSPNRLAKEWVKLILLLRRSRMSGPAIAERLKLPKSTVARVRERNGLSRLRALEPVRPVTRYEWDKPGDLLH